MQKKEKMRFQSSETEAFLHKSRFKIRKYWFLGTSIEEVEEEEEEEGKAHRRSESQRDHRRRREEEKKVKQING